MLYRLTNGANNSSRFDDSPMSCIKRGEELKERIPGECSPVQCGVYLYKVESEGCLPLISRAMGPSEAQNDNLHTCMCILDFYRM